MNFKFLIGVIFLCFISTAVYASQDKVSHIKQSFSSHLTEFLHRAKFEHDIQIMFRLHDETDPKTISHYLVMIVDSKNGIDSVNASKLIELEDRKVELFNEGIFLNNEGKYSYSLEHYTIDRNNNCKKENLDPVEIWDRVINHFFK